MLEEGVRKKSNVPGRQIRRLLESEDLLTGRQGVFCFYKFHQGARRGTSCVIAPPESQPREFHTDRRRERGSATENANTAKKGARGHVCQITGWIVPLSLSVRCEHCEGGRGRNEKCSSVLRIEGGLKSKWYWLHDSLRKEEA